MVAESTWQLVTAGYALVLAATWARQYVFVGVTADWRRRRADNSVYDILDAEGYATCVVTSLAPVASVAALLLRRRARQQVTNRWALLALWFMAAFATLSMAVFTLSRWSLLCDYNLTDLDNLCDYAHAFVTRVQKHPDGGPGAVWLINGTLMALMRHEPSRLLMLNDHDFDFCYEPSRLDAILAVSSQYGYLYRFLHIPASLYMLRFWPSWVEVQTGHSGMLTMDMEACKPPEGGVTFAKGCNGHMWPIPADFETSLTDTFGADWRTPKASNHWFICDMFGRRGLADT